MATSIRNYELLKLLEDNLEGFWRVGSDHYIGFSDDAYLLPSRSFMEGYLRYNPLPIVDPSLGEGFDCDDYAFALKGNMALYNRIQGRGEHTLCLGIVWGRFDWEHEYHAANWAVLRDERLVWIEPRTGRIETLNHCLGDITAMIL